MRNAMSIGEGNWSVFLQRPMSAALLAVVIAALLLPRLLKRRKRIGQAAGTPVG
jgi:putative tricarboxylic transport membrane protein